jgi:hypothetical protein
MVIRPPPTRTDKPAARRPETPRRSGVVGRGYYTSSHSTHSDSSSSCTCLSCGAELSRAATARRCWGREQESTSGGDRWVWVRVAAPFEAGIRQRAREKGGVFIYLG